MALSGRNQDAVREGGGLEALIKVLREGGPEAQTNAAGALRLLVRSAQNEGAICEDGCIEALLKVLRSGSFQAQVDAALVLWRLSSSPAGAGIAVLGALRHELAERLRQARRLPSRLRGKGEPELTSELEMELGPELELDLERLGLEAETRPALALASRGASGPGRWLGGHQHRWLAGAAALAVSAMSLAAVAAGGLDHATRRRPCEVTEPLLVA